MMRELIIKRANQKNEYVLEVAGYIPKELEEDLECMAEDFEGEEYLSIETIYDKIIDFKDFHRRRNGLIINFKINSESQPKYESYTGEFEPIQTVIIDIQVRRTFAKWVEELF